MPRKIQAFIKPERILTSYDFVDIARGKSVVEFYGGKISGGSSVGDANTFAASNIKWWSSNMFTDSIGGAGARIDKDFDIDFTFPKIVEGTVVVNVPVCIESSGGVAGRVYVDVIAYHVDSAGTEVEMGKGSTETYTQGNNTGIYCRMLGASIENIKQRFAPGETLRFTVKVYMAAAGATNVRLGHDPKNRSFDVFGETIDQDAPSQLTFQVPFKVFI